MRRILIVGAGGNQIGVIQKAKELGLYVVAIDGDVSAPGFSYADAFEAVNILDPDAVAQAARAYRADALFGAVELAVAATAEAAARLGLPGLDPEVGRRVCNKHAVRVALEAGGVPNPRFAPARTLDEAQAAFRDIGGPVIVKPADANASKGVRRVETEAELAPAFEDALPYSRSGMVLLESFMEGDEFCVDGLVYNGEFILGTITGKERSAPPNRFDLGIFTPPMLPQEMSDAIVAMTQRALNAIGFTLGITHIEVITTDEGVRIVEMAGRPGGGRIPSDLIPLTYGMDFMGDALRLALGEAPQERWRYERGAALFWFPAEPGVVEAIEGFEEVRALDGVYDAVMHVKPGDAVAPIIDCVTRDRIGYVLTTGADAPAAVALAKEAQRRCRVRTRKGLDEQ